MKNTTQLLRTLSTCVLRRLHVRSMTMTAATAPVCRVSWSQNRTPRHQLGGQGPIIQGRGRSNSSFWGTDETPPSAIFQQYGGGLQIIESGPDSPVIRSMSFDLRSWNMMTCIIQVSSSIDISDDEYQYLRQISNIPITGHRVLVVQPERKIKNEKSSVPLKLEETCALIRSLPCWHVVGKTRACGCNLIGPLTKDIGILLNFVTSNSESSAVVIGVDMLTPVQLNTLQTLWGLPVFDRYTIVLQILKDHARTYEAKLQVAMAEILHLRCRLSGVTGQHKQRLTGGGTRDTWLHNSRRLLQERELKLRTALSQVKNQRSLVRKKRQKKNIPTVAVVGYTNSGKTSLIEALTGDRKLEPRDQLFATLDVTVHAGTLPNMMSVLFIDTVGFIADIPVMLMEAFAATLEDAVLADLVLHVCDMSHPDCWRQRETVLKALQPMLLNHQMKSIIEVWNKVDIASDNSDGEHSLLVSATTGQNLDVLKARLQTQILTATKMLEKTFRLPMSASRHLSWLYKNATVTEAHPDTDINYILVNVVITEAAYGKFKAMFVKQ